MGFLSSVDSLCLDLINKNSVLGVFSVSLFAASHTAISRKVVAKLVHSTIAKGNKGYDQ